MSVFSYYVAKVIIVSYLQTLMYKKATATSVEVTMAYLTGMQEPQYSLFYKFSISSMLKPVACAMLSGGSPMAFIFLAISSCFISSPSARPFSSA